MGPVITMADMAFGDQFGSFPPPRSPPEQVNNGKAACPPAAQPLARETQALALAPADKLRKALALVHGDSQGHRRDGFAGLATVSVLRVGACVPRVSLPQDNELTLWRVVAGLSRVSWIRAGSCFYLKSARH